MAALACFCNVSTRCGLHLANSGHSFCSGGVYKNPCTINSLVQTLCCPCINGLIDSCHSMKLLKRLNVLFSRLKSLHSCIVSSFSVGVSISYQLNFYGSTLPSFYKENQKLNLPSGRGRTCLSSSRGGFLAYWLLCEFSFLSVS